MKHNPVTHPLLILLLFWILGSVPITAWADPTVPTIEINGTPVLYSAQAGVPFVDSAGRLQVPFRQTLEQFGANVDWEESSNTAIAQINGSKLKIPVGSNVLYKDGRKISSDSSAVLLDGRVYLPLRVVLEAFGAQVEWEAQSKTTSVTVTPSAIVAETDFFVHFIDVGQGDSILIDRQDYEILIDGGGTDQAQHIAQYLAPYIDGNLELVVATHEHEDHIGGLPAVFETFAVDRVLDNGRTFSSSYYEDYLSAITAEACAQSHVTAAAIEWPDGALFQVLPMAGAYSYPNENSIVSMLRYGNIELLFMGDLETTVERNNLAAFSDIDVLKVGHHGSRTATSQELLDIIKPEYSIISAGVDNEYLLPNAAVIERLIAANAAVYSTFRSGTIVMRTDGASCSFDTEILIDSEDAGALSGSVVQSEEPSAQQNNAVQEKDAAYIGNQNTMKFHTLDCTAGAKIADRNVIYFSTRELAVEAGYVPCKLCNP